MIRRVFLAFLVFGVTGCSDSIGPEDIAGTYTLLSVDGEGLPAGFGTPGLEIEAGSLTLNQDMTYSTSTTIVDTMGALVNQSASVGTYTFDQGAITLTPSEGGAASGSVSGATVTIAHDDGIAWVYEM